MPRVKADHLLEIARSLFVAVGTPPDEAEQAPVFTA